MGTKFFKPAMGLLLASFSLTSMHAFSASEEFKEKLNALVRNYIQFDANGNGRIDRGAESAALKAAFDQLFLDEFDSNGDGELDDDEKEELDEALEDMGGIVIGGVNRDDNSGGNSGGGGNRGGGGSGDIDIEIRP